MKNDVYDLPEYLYNFAQIANFQNVMLSLSQLADEEDWTYHSTPSSDDETTTLPILENYMALSQLQ